MTTETPRERQIRLASMTGSERVAAEREHQVEEGFTADHDDQHDHSELVRAARCYLEAGLGIVSGNIDADAESLADYAGDDWPWPITEFTPPTTVAECYTKAAALLAAEVDRLGRAG